MKITDIEIKHISIPLRKTFKTALRKVDSAENTILLVHTDDGNTGYGEAPPTEVITGETNESIIAVIKLTSKNLIGKEIEQFDRMIEIIDRATIGNSSAKAAIDMAIYDLMAKSCKKPLYQFLGGYHDFVETDLTISINEPEEMCRDAISAKDQGFHALKLKVGIDPGKGRSAGGCNSKGCRLGCQAQARCKSGLESQRGRSCHPNTGRQRNGYRTGRATCKSS